jgi:hypothetical protein
MMSSKYKIILSSADSCAEFNDSDSWPHWQCVALSCKMTDELCIGKDLEIVLLLPTRASSWYV